MNNIYYWLKPAIPWSIRMSLRRLLANHLRRRCSGSWPIYWPASRTPDGWPGWPDGKKFAFVVTHDVEGVRGLERCRKLAAVDKKLGFPACFNFVPEGQYSLPKSLRTHLEQQGFEVGVHDLHHDGSLYQSLRTFKEQASKINQYLHGWSAVGFRSGFMFHNLEWLHDLNVQYDASTFDTDPFEPQPDGVRTIFPFWVPGNNGKGYVELPYTLPQDSTLFLLLRETSIDLWVRKVDWVAKHGGMVLMVTHPDYMCFDGKSRQGEFPVRYYEDFLAYVREKYEGLFWSALPRDVASFYREHVLHSSRSHFCQQREAHTLPELDAEEGARK